MYFCSIFTFQVRLKTCAHVDSADSDWDCSELDSQEGEDMCNTLLITGPTGVGKTAAVYACAHELGFKVGEQQAAQVPTPSQSSPGLSFNFPSGGCRCLK